jgi:hypothetical protein
MRADFFNLQFYLGAKVGRDGRQFSSLRWPPYLRCYGDSTAGHLEINRHEIIVRLSLRPVASLGTLTKNRNLVSDGIFGLQRERYQERVHLGLWRFGRRRPFHGRARQWFA